MTINYEFSQRMENLSASLIRHMYNFALSDVPGFVSLGVGVPSFRLPKYVSEELSRVVANDADVNKYVLGRGIPELNSEFAKKLGRRNVYIDPEREVITTAGSAGGIFCTLMAIIDEGDEVIVPSPAYSNHIEVVKFAGGVPVYTRLIENELWKLDTKEIENKITSRTKAIILCNPSNPTGAIFPEEDLRFVGEVARSRNLYVLEDNAYRFATFDGKEHFTLTSVPEFRDNTIAFFTPSKEYAISGFRVGWVVSRPDVIDRVFDVQDQNYICAPSISQRAALIALKGPQEYVEGFKAELQRRRDIMCHRLDGLIDVFEYQRPQGAYYVFPKLKVERVGNLNERARQRLEQIPERFRTKDTEFALKLLYESGVVTVPGISFGPHGENHLRLSFAGESASNEDAFDRIERWMNR